MSDYQRDAYVTPLPQPWPDRSTHAVVIDIVTANPDEPIIHQIVHMVFGENNAKEQARTLNQWRDQTNSKAIA